MTDIKTISRRSVTTGFAAAVAAIPAVGLCVAARTDPLGRIRKLARELEEAMVAAYGGEPEIVTWGPRNPADPGSNMSPALFIIVQPKTA
jgi:hypothetical protein